MKTVLFVLLFGMVLYVSFKMLNKNPTSVGTYPTFYQTVSNISIEPYGCFSNLEEKFFEKQVNMYSKKGIPDSGIIISRHRTDHDMRDLLDQINENGFGLYANTIFKKYNSVGYNKMSIIEIAVVAKLAGYNYLSIYKIDQHTRGKIILSYSPPLDNIQTKKLTASDLPNYTLTPPINGYTHEEARDPGKVLACGYSCVENDKEDTFGDGKNVYMCGSVAYPNIKTPPRYAVYKINS
jgi:hypothetical protein